MDFKAKDADDESTLEVSIIDDNLLSIEVGERYNAGSDFAARAMVNISAETAADLLDWLTERVKRSSVTLVDTD